MSATQSVTQPLTLSDQLLGLRLGEYEVLELIGEGGMGVVYRGVQPIIKKRVAIKVLKPQVGSDQEHVQRLIDEAEAVNSIRHRGIIDIFSLGRLPDGRPYIVMEFLEGQPLDRYLVNARPSLAESVAVLIALCAPLAAAHRANVVHRDLKPSNVFLCMGSSGERYVKLLDFGIAKRTTMGRGEATRQARIIGTPNYMAPEQARGEAVTAATDVYALGVMAWELFTGTLPFQASSPMDMLFEHVNAPIPSLREARPDVPPSLEALVRRMLAKAPADRVPSVEQVRISLLEVARELGTSTTTFDTTDVLSGEFPVAGPGRVSLTVDQTLIKATGSDELARLTSGPVKAVGSRWVGPLAGLVAVLAAAVALTMWGPWNGAQPREEPGAAPNGAVAPPGAPSSPSGPSPALQPGQPSGVAGAGVTAPSAGPQSGAPNAAAGVQPGTQSGAREPQSAEVAAPQMGVAGGPQNGDAAQPGAEATVAPPTTAPGGKTKVGGPGKPPTDAALAQRLERLEASLKKRTPPGDEPNPAAMALLRKYRVQLTMLSTGPDRARMARTLDDFERTFLR